MVNENMFKVQYRNMEEFAQQNNKVNVVIAAFTTDYARLKLYDVVRALAHLHTNCNTEAKVTVDMPFKITRDKKEKNIVTKK